MAVFIAIMASFAFRLEIDASAENLLLEGDKDLKFTREISKYFVVPNFLVMTYSIEDDMLNEKNIKNIEELSALLKSLDSVESINSIVNVPLLQASKKTLKELVKDVPTLKSVGINKEAVKEEFLNSAIYKQNLVSDDFKTSTILINLKKDDKYYELIEKRDNFLILKKNTENIKKELKE